MKGRRTGRKVRALWSRTGVPFLRAESVALFCHDLVERWAAPARAQAWRPRWMTSSSAFTWLRWRRRGPSLQLVLPLQTSTATQTLLERRSESVHEHIHMSSSVLRFATSRLETQHLSTLLRASATERVLRERLAPPASAAAIGSVARSSLPPVQAPGRVPERVEHRTDLLVQRVAAAVAVASGQATGPRSVSAASMVSIRNLFHTTTVDRTPRPALLVERPATSTQLRTPAGSAPLRSAYAIVHGERLLRTPAAVPMRESERHAPRALHPSGPGQAPSAATHAPGMRLLSPVPTPPVAAPRGVSPIQAERSHALPIDLRLSFAAPTHLRRAFSTTLPLRATAAPAASPRTKAPASSAIRPALAYLRRGDSTVNERTLHDTITQKVQATVERKMIEHVNTVVTRATAPDSSLAQELGRAITADLHDSLVLARERMGWR